MTPALPAEIQGVPDRQGNRDPALATIARKILVAWDGSPTRIHAHEAVPGLLKQPDDSTPLTTAATPTALSLQ